MELGNLGAYVGYGLYKPGNLPWAFVSWWIDLVEEAPGGPGVTGRPIAVTARVTSMSADKAMVIAASLVHRRLVCDRATMLSSDGRARRIRGDV